MANFEQIPAPFVNFIKNELESEIDSIVLEPPKNDVSLSLGEVCKFAVIGVDDIFNNTRAESLLETPTNVWHQQIRYGKSARAFARFDLAGEDSVNWSLLEIAESAVPHSFDEAVKWADEHVREDYMVRLIELPGYFLHVFAFLGSPVNQVQIVDSQFDIPILRHEKLYGEDEFFQILRKIPPVALFS